MEELLAAVNGSQILGPSIGRFGASAHVTMIEENCNVLTGEPMTDFTKLRALGSNILFTFLDDTAGAKGRFAERTKGQIIIPVLDSAQHKTDRWGKVVSVGPNVYGVSPGEFILIKALQWTRSGEYEGQKIWKTNDEQVIVVTDDEDSTFTSM